MSGIAKSLIQIIPRKCYSTSYKSAISLEQIYPNSSLKLTTPKQPPAGEKFTGYIPIEQLNITYSKSSGPGGQNVNKVNTKVEVRFHVSSANWIGDDIRKTLLEKCKNKISNDGFLIFRSDITRSQQLNLADCLEKIRSCVRGCITTEQTPSEETLEKIRRRHEKAIRERLTVKRMRSQTKNDRRGPQLDL